MNFDYRIYYPILDSYGGPALLVLFGLLLFCEFKWSLRKSVQPAFERLLKNIGVAIPTMVAMRLALIPAAMAASAYSERHGFGLLYLVQLPAWLQAMLGFVLLDYLLYIWHVLSHRIPLFWRFHNVHHTDLDLTVSTGFRFHFGEMLLSGIFRTMGVLLLGVTPVVTLIYEVLFEAFVAFQHSNWRLPFRLEQALSAVFVTPRMHGIHHSIVRNETDSNFSNMFNIWDRLHNTLRLNVPQDGITIGVAGYQDESELTLMSLLTMPFRRQHDYWKQTDKLNNQRELTGSKSLLVP